MAHGPHPYGDCDACGDPGKLLDALEAEGNRLGIDMVVETSNSWDMSISLGARDVARLVLALRQVSEPTAREDADALMLALVDGVTSIGD